MKPFERPLVFSSTRFYYQWRPLVNVAKTIIPPPNAQHECFPLACWTRKVKIYPPWTANCANSPPFNIAIYLQTLAQQHPIQFISSNAEQIWNQIHPWIPSLADLFALNFWPKRIQPHTSVSIKLQQTRITGRHFLEEISPNLTTARVVHFLDDHSNQSSSWAQTV